MNNIYFPGYQINNDNYVLVTTNRWTKEQKGRQRDGQTQWGCNIYTLLFRNLKLGKTI